MKSLRALLTLCAASVACGRAPPPQPAAKPDDGGRVEWVDPEAIQPGPIRRDALSDEQMARIATMDTGKSLFFDHRDPAMVSWLAGRRIHD